LVLVGVAMGLGLGALLNSNDPAPEVVVVRSSQVTPVALPKANPEQGAADSGAVEPPQGEQGCSSKAGGEVDSSVVPTPARPRRGVTARAPKGRLSLDTQPWTVVSSKGVVFPVCQDTVARGNRVC